MVENWRFPTRPAAARGSRSRCRRSRCNTASEQPSPLPCFRVRRRLRRPAAAACAATWSERRRYGSDDLLRRVLLPRHRSVLQMTKSHTSGGPLVREQTSTMFGKFPFLRELFAGGRYQDPQFRDAQKRAYRLSTPRSSSARMRPRALRFCPAARSSKEPFHGSVAAEGWPRTSKISIARRWRFFTSPPSASCSEGFVIKSEVRGQTLRLSACWLAHELMAALTACA